MAHGTPLTERQRELRAFERLNLRFLVDAEDDRVVRRIQVEADDIADLSDVRAERGQRSRQWKLASDDAIVTIDEGEHLSG
jgi:hypothetical protein